MVITAGTVDLGQLTLKSIIPVSYNKGLIIIIIINNNNNNNNNNNLAHLYKRVFRMLLAAEILITHKLLRLLKSGICICFPFL